MTPPFLARAELDVWIILAILVAVFSIWAWDWYERRRPVKILLPAERDARDWYGKFRFEELRDATWEADATETLRNLILKDEDPAVLIDRATIAIYADDRSAVRCLAAIHLASHPHPAAEAGLIAALQDEDETVRRTAALSLVKVGSVRGLAAVVAGSRHGHGVRTTAAYRLEALGPSAVEAIPSLITLLRYSMIGNASHMAASAALVAVGAPAIPALIPLMHAKASRQRFYAALTLQQIGVSSELAAEVERVLAEVDGK